MYKHFQLLRTFGVTNVFMLIPTQHAIDSTPQNIFQSSSEQLWEYDNYIHNIFSLDDYHFFKIVNILQNTKKIVYSCQEDRNY